MATVLRRRFLINPARRRRNARRKKRRRMSDKQIRHFGTAAQKAALRRRHRHSNPRGGRSSAPRRRRRRAARRRASSHRRRSNVGEIITLGLANPAQRRSMRKRRKSRRRRARNRGHRRSYRRRASNPVVAYRVRRRRRRSRGGRRRRRRNPIMGRARGFLGRGVGMVQQGALVIGGAIGARTLTQVILRGNNTGLMGYLGNAVSGHLLGTLVGRATRNPRNGQLITLGAYVGIALRLLQDYTPLGKYTTLSLSGNGLRGDFGMGFLEPTTFFVPLAPADGRGATSAAMALPAAVRPVPRTAGNMGMLSRYGGRSRYA